MSALSQHRRIRRTVALATATAALAGLATIAGAGTAHADAELCGTRNQGGSPGSPWYGWALTPCIDQSSMYPYPFYSRVYVTGGSTDVRVYTGVYDSCNGVTYGINGDSPDNLVFAGQSKWVYSRYVPSPHCPGDAGGVRGIARITESGHGSPWVRSNGMGAP
ncbi:hypothetical protein [Yinghuangia seranimata]|uniref:hypothetical protein n=1 Tax=Yinghuangia seranimata TaxID=408067 RepID=UPI00248CF82E|nr:hypothetical protein [Yinghuangia seranimata]MDI2126566.1 hypothetical protein [Yinghuangia seranimata]